MEKEEHQGGGELPWVKNPENVAQRVDHIWVKSSPEGT